MFVFILLAKPHLEINVDFTLQVSKLQRVCTVCMRDLKDVSNGNNFLASLGKYFASSAHTPVRNYWALIFICYYLIINISRL